MMSTPLGTYIPGNSLFHRLHPALKIVGLLCWIIILSVFFKTPLQLLIPAILSVAAIAVSRVPIKSIVKQLLPVMPILILIGGYQWWATDAQVALRICAIIFFALLAAILVTSTTSTSEMLDGYLVLLSPLEKLGLNTSRIALVFSLTLQLIPAVGGIVNEIKEARRSRGADRSLRALFLPLLVRLVRRADMLAEALVARGYEDD